MSTEGQETNVRVDTYTRGCLTVISVLLTILIIGLWAEKLPEPHGAGAAEPFLNSSAQRDAMVDLQKQTNGKLDELISLLRSGSVKVQVVEAPSQTGGATHVKSEKPR